MTVDAKRIYETVSEVFDGEEGPREAIEFMRELIALEERKPVGWRDWFMMLAKTIATKSKDATRVGAVAFDSASRYFLAAGFNGIPMGVRDLEPRYERPEKYLWVSHAEENLVASAARKLLEGSTVVVTHKPCARCARLLVQAGVKRVIVGDGTTSMPDREFEVGRTIFHEAEVCCSGYESLGESNER